MLVNVTKSWVKVLFATFAVVAILGACGGGTDDGGSNDSAADTTPTEDAAEAGALEFATTEYAFSVPPTVPAGQTTVTLVNNGEEPHMLDFAPLTPDAPPIEKLIKLPQKKAQSFFAGRPIHINPVKPGETSKPVKTKLAPGRYGYVCFFSKKGEKPHAFRGMYGALTVK